MAGLSKITINLCVDGGRMLIFFRFGMAAGSLLLNHATAVSKEKTKVTITLCVDGAEAILQHTWVGGRRLIFFVLGWPWVHCF